jgi:radical SAM superfamily enzyme YgiQ (UPF0313 family)
MQIVLIHPPLTRPCEPPAGIARLAGALKANNRSCRVIDMNMEGLVTLLNTTIAPDDTWTRRASLHLQENLASIRDGAAFRGMDSYTKAVTEISRILEVSAQKFSAHMSLNNFQHTTLSSVRSTDLIHSSEHPEENVFYPYFKKRLSSMLEENRPDYVGFSLNYLSQALTTFAMIGLLRTLDRGVKIILGGGLLTSWMNRPDWNNPFSGLADELVAGPGEEHILKLAGAESVDCQALPDYQPFWDRDYLSPGRVLPLSASSGCYWGRCSFCPEKTEGNRYFPIPAPQVMTGLERLMDLNSPSLIHMIDNAMSPSLLKAMAGHDCIAPWYGFTRITHHLADPEFCSALARSGCVMLQLGLESGDQKVLDELDKGIRLDEAARVLESLHKAGIAAYVYLLFGTPAEDEASARMTLDYVARHAEFIDFLNLSIFNLPKGSPDAGKLETYDFFDGDLSLYQGFVHPKGWDRNRVRQFLDKEFKRNAAIARIVRNDPPYFTSNHAPFFTKKKILHDS